MGTNSLQAAAAPKRRSLNLLSFRRSSAAHGMTGSSVEEAARVQKAAAWQWYTRGVGENVLLAPTRPAVVKSQAPASDDKSCIGASGLVSKGFNANLCNSNTPQRSLAEPHRAASRFKAEAGSLSFITKPAASGDAPPPVPAPPPPSGGPSGTPLYDELELSSLRTHMADVVHRLHHQHTLDNEQRISPAVGVHGRSRSPPPSVSIDHHQTKARPPAVAVASSGHDKPTTLSSSPEPVASTIPFHMRPFSALQKLVRKMLSRSVPKCTKNSSQFIDSAPAVYGQAETLYNAVGSTTQYHHHHYIHHHHHHHHFSRSPDQEQASIILSRRRHSDSASSRPCTPSLVEADSDEEEDEDEVEEESRIAAYLARRRRRHSHSFSKYGLLPENAGFCKDEGMKEESAKVESPMRFSRRYNSQRFLPSKIPAMVGKDFAQPVEDEFDEGSFGDIIRSRRRHSAELYREEASLERITGGKSKSGAYVLGGAGARGGTPGSMPMDRRRHSEVIRPEAGARRTPSPGRPIYNWIPSSARYFGDVQERHMGVRTEG